MRLPAVARLLPALLLLAATAVPAAAAEDDVPAERRTARTERGGGFQELYTEYELTGSGAWNWFGDPRAVHFEGERRQTYIGWLDRTGSVKVTAYDHDTGNRETAVVRAKFQVDDHNNPSLLVRPDGRVMAFWSGHGGKSMFYRITKRPEDVTTWERMRTVPSNTPGPYGYTYPNPVQLSAEADKIYLFWRGGNFNPALATSSGGRAWSPAKHLIDMPGQRPYVKVDSNGTDTIHLAFSDAHPASAPSSIYYMAYRDGSFFKADGTRIGGMEDLPFSPEQTDKIYDVHEAGGVRSWIHDVGYDADGKPVLTFATFPGFTGGRGEAAPDHRYHYARWTGTEWFDFELPLPAGGPITGSTKEPLYSGGITLDHEDPGVVYLSREVSGVHEIERWTTTDGGETFEVEPVTSGSAKSNFRPISPRGLPKGEDMEVVWMEGDYPFYTTFNTVLNRSGVARDNATPEASWTRNGGSGLTVKVDATRSRDADGRVVRYAWRFGDGRTGTGVKATHTYRKPGVYPVAVTITDDSGARDTFAGEVTVRGGTAPAPAQEPEPQPSTGSQPEPEHDPEARPVPVKPVPMKPRPAPAPVAPAPVPVVTSGGLSGGTGGTGTTGTAPAPVATPGRGGLPFTGAPTIPLAAAAGVALLLGVALILAGRRRRVRR